MFENQSCAILDHLPRSRLAEGPYWDAETHRMIWVDIVGHVIHRYDPRTAQGTTCPVSDVVGFAVLATDGRLVAGIGGGIYDLAFDEPTETLLTQPGMHGANRFNDAKCDPRGRLWAGTMHRDATRDREATGALYRWHHGQLEEVEPHISLANGLGWSSSGDTMYFSDTHQGTVWAYDYDLVTGSASNRRAFIVVPIEVGVPDGLCVDGAGRVYVAIWRGSCIRVYAPSGDIEGIIKVPVRNPTSCCFGGADLKTLFVTTMPSSNENDPRSGSLFAVTMDTPGQPSERMNRSL
nr:SMP-30/gluconolactonase/LRE family protein [Beijerinckia sp. L45]